ncbi:uncharacterized protein PSFLO_03063 [Pseudozyma flocculosa]|uniref:C2H2-type domain-containing protein n=1 Tax=Pseudozyma flocculosa TaxID=84751 RepID=A0A5C3EZE5_9BASI|nr:uncharacterized protein PSFLO_03063 [Pseudozyma flocculosa]
MLARRQTYTIPSSIRNTYDTKEMTSTIPLTSFSPPSKGYFTPSSSLPPSRSETMATATANAPSVGPTRGRRRESLTGQMRRKASVTTAAAGGGASGLSITRGQAPGSPNGQPIPRPLRSPGMMPSDMAGLSASFGAAGEALSLSSSVTSNATIGPFSQSLSNSNGPGLKKEPRSLGHSHFGKECFGPSSTDLTNNPPSSSMLSPSSSGPIDATRGNGRDRRNSASSTGTMQEEDDGAKEAAASAPQGHQQLHKCESCAKVYRHPSCLVKHRWEHTVYWKEASKFLMSKHQQVQLLEAAAILVGMDSNARSLPEEKALWPAAVSPPLSGLLGSDQINFDTLMAAKRRNATATPSPARGPTPGLVPNDSSDGSTSSAYDASHRSGTLSPLSGLGQLRLGGNETMSRSESYGRHGGKPDTDVRRFRLDDAENSHSSGSDQADRSGSAEMDDDDDEGKHAADDERDRDRDQERYGMDAGGDVMAEMEMDDVV